MTNQDIKEWIACFEKSSLQSMKLSTQEFTIELSRSGNGCAAAASAPSVSAPAAAAAPAPAPVVEEGRTVTAPLVGTFYAAPAPEKPPFVQPGQRVKQGETLCLIEAMKMMSEIAAPCDCVIEAALARDGELLAFDAPIFRYREA